ncbi:MAG: hypothetical protein JW862_02280 [Anaerolineales bacterium]|nr:hypothetical protein [Anaerolineales bacterium]
MNRLIRRFVAALWLLTSLAWVVLSLAALYYGLSWVDRTANSLNDNLGIVSRNLEILQNILVESGDTLAATEQALDTVQSATENASVFLTEFQPLLIETSQTITRDVPDALDEIQQAMPTVITTAKAVDDTLMWLSGFSITIPTFIGQPIVFDLGVDYNPEVPLDEALAAVSDSIVDVPENLRGLETDLSNADANLVLISADLETLSENLAVTSQELSEIHPELDDLAAALAEILTVVERSQERLPAQVKLLSAGLWAICALLALSQVPGLFFGWFLLRRDIDLPAP